MPQPQDPIVASPASLRGQPADDWENWDDDEVVTPIEPAEQVLINAPPAAAAAPVTSARSSKPLNSTRASRASNTKLKRLRSKQRQKAQNAQAGIKLITDMTAFRRPTHIAHHMRSPDGKPIKFVDAAALRALEGEPNSASVGNWNWLKKSKQNNKSPVTVTPIQSTRTPDQELSPEDRPIVIGISIPSEGFSDSDLSPQTATTATSIGLISGAFPQPPGSGPSAPPTRALPLEQQISVWSPDTPDTAGSSNSFRPVSSIYSQHTGSSSRTLQPSADVPPVPALPANYKKTPQQRLVSLELSETAGDSDDAGTPCTLFEEDGAPSPLRVIKGKPSAFTPDSAESRSHGWWDHVVTPFVDKRLTFTSRRQKIESPKADCDSEVCSSADTERYDEKKPAPRHLPVPIIIQPPIVRAPTPKRTPSPRLNQTVIAAPIRSPDQTHPALVGQPSVIEIQSASVVPGPSSVASSPALGTTTTRSEKPPIISSPGLPSTPRSPPTINTRSSNTEKPQIVLTDIPRDQPPPYSPPKRQQEGPIRYRAVFPPDHPLHSQFPPSPGLGSPGLAATMTSQGATPLTEIPITPTVPREMPSPPSNPLPTRAVGSYLPQEHVHSDRARDNSAERQRQRHEKEEVVARRIGGFWRGRGCIPARGCFGRTGAEGRKRRRIWLGVIAGGIAAIIIIIVLSIVLTRPKKQEELPSIWVNITGFPPMPTGTLTVVGPDNIEARNGCTEPSTLWSCAVPKDDQESLLPYKPNQPTIIMHIQWDNGTDNSWDVPNGDPPASIEQRSSGLAAHASHAIRKRQAVDFSPNPKPPSFEEMWFLGDTTDSIEGDDKAGEPTPFYISLLNDINEGGDGGQSVEKRQNLVGDLPVDEILPPPDLLEDRTPAPAIMLPDSKQQPVRLYDKGLPTEHYGFYTYFKRTLFLKSVTRPNETDAEPVPLDEDGGCRKNEANFLTTWSETRLLVRIWTQKFQADNSTLLQDDGSGGIDIGSGQKLIRPGTMPYPVTVTLDTHGGDPDKKFVWEWPMNERLEVDADKPQLMANDISFGGPLINPRKDRNESFGGFDGGSGGCRCEWVNWA